MLHRSPCLELEQLLLRACRYEEYVPRKKRREADEAVLLRLQGVSTRHCSSRQTRQHLEHQSAVLLSFTLAGVACWACTQGAKQHASPCGAEVLRVWLQVALLP
jgi:hypothetical protein